MKDDFIDPPEPLDYTIADICKIIEKEAKVNKLDVNRFNLEKINEILDDLDFAITNYQELTDVIIQIMDNMWQHFKHSGISRVLNVTLSSKNILNELRGELIEEDIDCYIFGDITNDANGYIFMRVQFDCDIPRHVKKLKELKIINDISEIDFDAIQFNLFDERWDQEGWQIW